jgi:nitrate/TMAO reductase-like tetraheme cytochrome c subunit
MSEPDLTVKPRRSRWVIAGLVVASLLVLFALFLGGVAVFNWTESTAFCSSCHNMKPEVTAYHNSPHSKVDCGSCHIGPGVIPALQAKLASIRYVWEYPLSLYPRPIPSPITSLRPVEVVCEQCHWPQKAYADRAFVQNRYATDEQNSLTQINMQVHTGNPQSEVNGPSRGIHWHIDNPVYYIATDDQRQDIPWVQAEFNGVKTEYVSTDSKLTPEQIASAEKRKMDCVDCHNRATHIFQQPSDALDAAMSGGAIAADLPYIKLQAMEVLSKTYATEGDAASAISAIPGTYKTKYPDVYAKREADIKKATTEIQSIFDKIQFPFMKVTPDTHPDNIGHKDFPGCFRCHDGKHLSQDNQAIRLECNVCHAIPQEAGPGQTLQPIPVVTQTEPDSHKSTTWLAEHRNQFDASCANCHTVNNPGGTDNSSFCSNSACHATQWKYASLDAPQLRSLGAPPKAPSTGQPPAIPHPVGANTDCKICHGPDKVRPFPANHASYTIDMCTGCHKATVQEGAAAPRATAAPGATAAPAATDAPSATTAPSGGIPAIPHEIAGREQCLTCHNPDGGIKPAPQDHVGRTNDTCQNCHKPAAAAAAGSATTAPTGTAAPTHTVEATATAESTSTTLSSTTATPSATATADTTATPAAAATPAVSVGGPPAIPHELTGRENCLLCHNPDGGVQPAPPDHVGRTVDFCQMCHKPSSS